MRIRLLIDTTLDEAEVAKLAELISEQPSALVEITGFNRVLGARFMGATPVHQDEAGAH